MPNKNAVSDEVEEGGAGDDGGLRADEIWKVATSGKNKGKLEAVKDSHGCIVVDPVGNINKD